MEKTGELDLVSDARQRARDCGTGQFTSGPRSWMRLLADARVRSWIKSYPGYNVQSTKGYSLEAFLKNSSLTVEELFNMADDELRRAVTAVVETYVSKDKPSVARNILYTVKTLFSFHDRDLKLKHFRGLRRRKRIRYEIIPTSVDVYQMAEVAGTMSSKNKAIILCLFQSGVPNNCITHWTYGMVKDYLYPHIKIPVNLKITSQIDTKLSGYGFGFLLHVPWRGGCGISQGVH